MNDSLCPYCSREGFQIKVEVLKIRTVGVAFKCPHHGHCGARFDSMDYLEVYGLLPLGHLTPSRYPSEQ